MSGQDELERIIEDAMIEHGPDGHCDGADKIAEAVRAYCGSRDIEAENARLRKHVDMLQLAATKAINAAYELERACPEPDA